MVQAWLFFTTCTMPCKFIAHLKAPKIAGSVMNASAALTTAITRQSIVLALQTQNGRQHIK